MKTTIVSTRLENSRNSAMLSLAKKYSAAIVIADLVTRKYQVYGLSEQYLLADGRLDRSTLTNVTLPELAFEGQFNPIKGLDFVNREQVMTEKVVDKLTKQLFGINPFTVRAYNLSDCQTNLPTMPYFDKRRDNTKTNVDARKAVYDAHAGKPMAINTKSSLFLYELDDDNCAHGLLVVPCGDIFALISMSRTDTWHVNQYAHIGFITSGQDVKLMTEAFNHALAWGQDDDRTYEVIKRLLAYYDKVEINRLKYYNRVLNVVDPEQLFGIDTQAQIKEML